MISPKKILAPFYFRLKKRGLIRIFGVPPEHCLSRYDFVFYACVSLIFIVTGDKRGKEGCWLFLDAGHAAPLAVAEASLDQAVV